MSFSASPWTATRFVTGLVLLTMAGCVLANTPGPVPSPNIDSTADYSPADAQGRFTYMIEFAEPGLIEQHRQRSSAEFDYRSSANLAARDQLVAAQEQHVGRIGRILGRSADPSHHYLATRNGIALRLTPDEAAQVAGLDGVKAIERERVYELDTFRGPEFIGAASIWDGSSVPGNSPLLGELMIAAVLDTGIPDPSGHPSFANDPACGHGTGVVPDKVLSSLDCSATDGTGLCNGPNPIDSNGHGSHTASTVAGNEVDNSDSPSPDLPAPFTSISGVAPCAHIRSYKTCPGSCPGADLAAGMESVLIHGDADVMNYSISGGTSPWNDFDRTKLDLVDTGVFVAASAGNTSATITNPVGQVNHRGPWVMSVAASTHDGLIGKAVSLAGGPTDVFAIEGSGPAMTVDFTGDLRYAGDVDAANVEGCSAFPANAFDGEAALISRGTCAFADKVNNAVAAGATFVIVHNNAPGLPIVMGGLGSTTVSSVMVSQDDGMALATALAGGTAEVTVPVADAGFVEPAAGDILAGFSFRGPTPSPLQDLQKPNITAPGVNILAAVPGGYGFISGTSMSGPHVAGAGVLVRQANPDWTVSEVKSAIQMTASRDGNKEDGSTPWDWDDVGHGRVDLSQAALSGLVMDESIANYLAADPATGGDVKTLNTPDVRNLDCTPSCTFERTLRNTMGVATDWTVTAESSHPDLDLQVTPSNFSFIGDTEETITLTITATPQADLTAGIEFGQILLTEDADQAPEAHLTTAISGTNFEPPSAVVDTTEFEILLEENDATSTTFNISNVGEAGLSEDLTYSIDEASPATVVLDATREADPPQPITLSVDQHSGPTSGVGLANQEIVWFNQLTPDVLDLPFDLEAVQILEFATANFNTQAGDVYDVHVWSDPDGNPQSGDEVLLSSVLGETIGADPAFVNIPLPSPVPIDQSTGDVLIGLVNRTTRDPYFPALSDSGAESAERSWIAFNFPGGVAGSPPDLSQAGTFALIDDLGLPRNWVIRGLGTGGSACLTPADVPWLTVNPVSGTVAPESSEEVTVSVDMNGLGQGTFEARVCVNTNDPLNPVFVLPLTVQVTGAGGLPTIGVTPASVTGTVDVLNPTGSESIDISNSGNDLDLEWFFEEAEGAPSPGICDAPSDVSWLSTAPSSGITAAGGTTSVSVDFDASGLEPGLYEATLCAHSNDPATPLVEVPVSLDVTVPANAARIEGTVLGLGHCQAAPAPAAGADVEIVGTSETFNLVTDANGFYSLFLDEANDPVDITASALDHLPDSQVGLAIAGETTTVADFDLVLEAPCALVSPGAFSEVFGPGDTGGDFAMTIDNGLGGDQLVWGIQEADSTAVDYSYGLEGAGEMISTTGGVRGGETVTSERQIEQSPMVDPGTQGAPISSNFTEAFDDVTLLPGAGWALQNQSDPLGMTDWFQGNDAVFPAHEGDPGAYIGANFNNTGGTGTISNWLMTPEVELWNGTELSFWTRVPDNPATWADRLELRLSTSGSSTFTGSSATDVGDFDELLLSVNENLESTGYPGEWTQFTATVSGLAQATSGRFAFRYFVTSGGPSGTNSSYIGIDTVSVGQPDFCSTPADVPWLSVAPFFGAADAGDSSAVTVSVDTSGLSTGIHEAFICVSSNDDQTGTIQVPFSIEVLGDGIFQDRFEG